MQNATTRLMLVLLIGACLALAGCEDDDNSTSDAANVVGTWSGTYVGAETYSVVFTLNADGTVSGTARSSLDFSGTWTFSGSVFRLSGKATTQNGENISAEATVSGDTMSGTWTTDWTPEGGPFSATKQ